MAGEAPIKAVKGRILTAATIDAENTFKAPDQVKPQPFEAQAVNGKLTIKLPPKSMVVVAAER